MLVAADGGRPPEGEEGAAPAAAQPPGAAPPPDRPPQRAGRFAQSYVVFDLETLIGDAREQQRIIEIAALKFVDGVETGKFRSFVDPGLEIDALTENKTHISSEMVAGAPAVEAALPEFSASEYFKALRGYKYEQVRDFYGLLEAQGYVTRVYKEINGQQ